MDAMTENIVVFTHVPKVAGTSVMRRLVRANYEPEDIKTYAGERDLWRNRGTFRILVGNNTWGAQYLAGRDARLFTMLQDPVERAISHYYFVN